MTKPGGMMTVLVIICTYLYAMCNQLTNTKFTTSITQMSQSVPRRTTSPPPLFPLFSFLIKGSPSPPTGALCSSWVGCPGGQKPTSGASENLGKNLGNPTLLPSSLLPVEQASLQADCLISLRASASSSPHQCQAEASSLLCSPTSWHQPSLSIGFFTGEGALHYEIDYSWPKARRKLRHLAVRSGEIWTPQWLKGFRCETDFGQRQIRGGGFYTKISPLTECDSREVEPQPYHLCPLMYAQQIDAIHT